MSHGLRPLFPAALLLLCLALWSLAAPSWSLAQDTGASGSKVEEMIEMEKERAKEQQQELDKLKAEEAALADKLAKTESRVKELTGRIKQQQAKLDEINVKEEAAQNEYLVLKSKQEGLAADLHGLLAAIWPVHAQNIQSRFGNLENWQSADRAFTWLSAIYRQTREKLAEAVEAVRLIQENLATQRQLAMEAQEQLARVNALKDDVLNQRLSLRSDLGKVKDEKVDLQAELKDILGVIQDLNYQLGSQVTKRFPDNKALLPWPANGRLVASFAPSAKPPVRGVGISLGENAEVRAVFWGKVVHNDVLRGFGRVVIIYHGHDYYTLYAYLSEAYPLPGQEVEKDEPIGKAGYYPGAKGPGLYFELRFGQKAINPVAWLSPQ